MGLRAMRWDSGKCEILCAEWAALGHTWQLGLHAPFRAVGLCHAAARTTVRAHAELLQVWGAIELPRGFVQLSFNSNAEPKIIIINSPRWARGQQVKPP